MSCLPIPPYFLTHLRTRRISPVTRHVVFNVFMPPVTDIIELPPDAPAPTAPAPVVGSVSEKGKGPAGPAAGDVKRSIYLAVPGKNVT